MKRLLPVMVLGSFFLPAFVSAQALTDVYGDAIFSKSALNVVNADNAVGAPDGKYADFRSEGTYMTLDMGQGEEGFGDLIVTMKAFDSNATGRVTLYDSTWGVLTVFSPLAFASYQTSWVVPYSGATPYRYVKIESMKSGQWSVDAIQATQVDTPVETPVTPPPASSADTIPYCTQSDCGRAGELIKLSNDSAVYFVGLDGMRHVFPNEQILNSWSFENSLTGNLQINEITADQMAAIPLGHNMTVRPGTYMVKIVHDPKVYAVEPGGVLRWVSSEAIANALYGSDWNKQVIDIDETFWKNYSVGAPILSADEPPAGYVFIDNSTHYIVTKDGARALNSGEIAALRLDDQFAGVHSLASLKASDGAADNSDLSPFVEAF